MPDRDNGHRSGGDPLRDVRRVKRLTQIVTYAGILGLIASLHFMTGISWLQALATLVGGFVIATYAIEGAFWQMYKLRKQGMYPSLLAVELGSTRDLRQACQRGTEVLANLLGADASVLALLHKNESGVEILATHGVPPGAIGFDGRSAAHLQPFRDAIRHERIISEPLRDSNPLAPAFGPGRQMVYVPVVSMNKAVGVIALIGRRSSVDLKDRALLGTVGQVMGLTLDNVRLYNHEYQTLLHILCSALDLRDRITEGHSRRVATLSLAVARELGVDGEELIDIERGAILHDIGKITIPDAILSKPEALTPNEWEEMRKHPEVGYQMVKDVPFLRRAAEIIYAHHERYDGAGYPRGLKGEGIPLGARIFAVVDAYDAITSDRPYRRARSHEEGLAEVRRFRGSQFDPQVTEAFLRAEQAGLITAGSACPSPQKPVHELVATLFPSAM